MPKNLKINGTEEIGLVTPSPDPLWPKDLTLVKRLGNYLRRERLIAPLAHKP